MKRVLLILFAIVSFIGCSQHDYHKPEPFEFTIKGTIPGMEKGKIFFRESPRVGDEVFVEVKDGKFSYSGKSLNVYITGFQTYDSYLSGGGYYFPLIIEPGIIEMELNKDSIHKSKVVKGELNLKHFEQYKIKDRYLNEIWDWNKTEEETDSVIKVYSDSLYQLVYNNKDNFCSVHFLKQFVEWNLLDDSELSKLFIKIKDPELRHTPDFKFAYSMYLAKRDSINKTGTKAANFILPDSSGKMIDFSEINKGKMVFVEESGSWCGNQTDESHKLDPVYKEYKDKGFEIITIVQEAKYDRWKKWVEKQKFPWINVVEMQYGNTNDVYYTDLLFANGDYLVDENGIVVANDLSAEQLNELLMEKYEPEKYNEYTATKWDLPESTYILDKDKPVTSFAELTEKLKGKAFFIDCWATWCSPCIEEFQYNASLKEFLKTNNIEMVYIAFDKKLDDAKWLSYITKHNLTGYNMRVNEDFMNDFRKITDWNTALPSYFIVKSTGEIVTKPLLNPGEKDKLYSQIRELLGLKE